jgi:hypothetical protein
MLEGGLLGKYGREASSFIPGDSRGGVNFLNQLYGNQPILFFLMWTVIVLVVLIVLKLFFEHLNK